MPAFEGGPDALVKWLQKNLKYPDMEYEAGIQGKVYVEFTVDKDGSVRDVELKRGLSPGLDKEALRAVKADTSAPALQKEFFERVVR